MLRITQSGIMTVAVIDLDGKLVGPWVDELQRAIGAIPHGDEKRLNLAKLAFADAAGLRLLHALRRDGVEFVGALPLIAALLALHSDIDTTEAGGIEHA